MMRVEVTTDLVRREVEFSVVSGTVPELNIAESWHKRRRLMRPTHGRIVLVDGEPLYITVSGPVLRANGETTAVTGSKEWTTDKRAMLDHSRISRSPKWVQVIWNGVCSGESTWQIPEDNQ